MCFTTGYSGGWNSPYSGEATYAALYSKDPLFANFPTDGTLSSSSPAIGAGVAITTVAAGDSGSGTTLILNNAHGLQPGWAGTQGDWIRIGATNTAQITGINYTTNTVTLAAGVSRSSGHPVYLYANSSGTVVLNGASPDLGAFPYGSTSAPLVSLSVSSIAFGTIAVGTSNPVLLWNSGNATLNITSIVAPSGFSQSNTCGSTLTALASCTITVSLTGIGSDSGNLTITTDAASSPDLVALSGTGYSVPAAAAMPMLIF